MSRYKDLTGQKFGELTVIEKTDQRLRGGVAWRCKCSCGNEIIKTTYALKHNKRNNCGSSVHIWSDLIGKTINELTVVSITDKYTVYSGSNINPYYNCICSCGKECQVSRKSLLGNHVKSCGHLRTVNDDDFIGKKFGRLTPIARVNSEDGPPKYLCQCDCGNQCISLSSQLNNKHYRSCGCYVSERLSKMNRKYNNVVYHNDYVELFDSFGNSTKLLFDDYEKVKDHYWYMTNSGYFQGTAGLKNSQKIISLHRFIMGLNSNDKRVVDHINGDTTDNRRDNLRICTVTENVRNSKIKSSNKTGIPGVSKRNNVYDVTIQRQRIGVAKTLDEAAIMRYKAETERFGQFARGDWYKNFEEVLKNVST